MNLKQLSEEYRAAADQLQDRIAALRAELPTARGEKAFAMQKRIDLLYAELLDVRTIMGYLQNYYND